MENFSQYINESWIFISEYFIGTQGRYWGKIPWEVTYILKPMIFGYTLALIAIAGHFIISYIYTIRYAYYFTFRRTDLERTVHRNNTQAWLYINYRIRQYNFKNKDNKINLDDAFDMEGMLSQRSKKEVRNEGSNRIW